MMKKLMSSALISCVAFSSVATAAVDLKFGWTPGMSCQVKYQTRKSDGAPSSLDFVLKTTAAKNGGLLITSESPNFSSGKNPADKLSAQDAMYLAAMVMPAFEVDSEGRFAGLQDIDAVRKAAEAVFNKAYPDADAAMRKRVMELVGAKAMLENSARLFWSPAVESWRASSWEPGEKFETELDTVLPIGNAGYTAKYVGEFKGPHACKQEQPAGCVLMASTQTPDPESLAKAMIVVLESTGTKPGDQDSLGNVDVRVFTETVMRPETMVPTRVTFEKKIHVTGTEKGKPMEHSATERRDWLLDCG